MAASLQATGSATDAERASARAGLEQAEVLRSRPASFESFLHVRGLRPGITGVSGRKSSELGQIRRTLQRDFGPENVSAGKVAAAVSTAPRMLIIPARFEVSGPDFRPQDSRHFAPSEPG